MGWRRGLVGGGGGVGMSFVECFPAESSTLAALVSRSTYGGEGRPSGVLTPAVDGDAVDAAGSRSASAMGEKVLWLPSLSDSSSSSE